MIAKKITVKIDTCGRPAIEAEGYVGDSCKTATKPIEDVLRGKGEVETTYKYEYHQTGSEEEEETLGM